MEAALRVCCWITFKAREEMVKESPPVDALGLRVGISCWEAHEELALSHVLKKPDEALYQAKRGARNKIHVGRRPLEETPAVGLVKMSRGQGS